MKSRLINLHGKDTYIIQLFMIKLKLSHSSWVKGFDCLFFNDNTIIVLLLKK
jgi:hypothetical protein